MSKRSPARRTSMPAGAEAVRAEKAARRAQRTAKATAPPPVIDTGEGAGIIRSSWIGTAIFAVGAGVAAAIPDARLPVAAIDLALFFGGIVVFFWAWAIAAGRSREREITLWNLVLLEDIAPRRVRWSLLGALAIQILVALATAWITAALAFGILVPMWGEAHCWLWGARYGAFGPRKTPVPRRAGRGRKADTAARQ